MTMSNGAFGRSYDSFKQDWTETPEWIHRPHTAFTVVVGAVKYIKGVYGAAVVKDPDRPSRVTLYIKSYSPVDKENLLLYVDAVTPIDVVVSVLIDDPSFAGSYFTIEDLKKRRYY